MGIFSNRCEALVNPVTGWALSGAALIAAQKEPSWPRCGHSVSKSSHFCPKCHAPAPGGWIKCPQCGEWVGNDSHFCWNCNTPLHPDARTSIANGVWCREAGVFAQRFEAYDLQSNKGAELQVQEGTAAILISGGAVEDVLDAGRFKLESTARKINWFGNPPNRSAVLLEAGEMILPVEVTELPTRASEETGMIAGVSVNFRGEAIIRFAGDKESAIKLLDNAMKQQRSLSFGDLTERLKGLLAAVVRDFCQQTTLEDLLKDSSRREKLREEMSRHLEDDLDSIGMDLVRMSSAEFKSPAYSALVAQNEELDKRRRHEEYLAAVRAFEKDFELKRFRDENAFLEAKEALEHEHNVNEEERRRVWEKLQREAEDAALREQQERDLARAIDKENYDEKKQEIEDRATERRRQRELMERARQAEEEEAARKKSLEEKIRKQKEEDEERIRKWAQLEDERNHRWKEEDETLKHTWSNETQRLQHEAEVAAMVQRASKAKLEADIDEERVRLYFEFEKNEGTATSQAKVTKIQVDSGLEARAKKAAERQQEQNYLLEQIQKAVQQNDELTAALLRDQYRELYVKDF